MTTLTATHYFEVPGPYGYGPRFDTYQEARIAALDRIREIDGCPGSFTRAFVDLRISDHAGDRLVRRREVFA